ERARKDAGEFRFNWQTGRSDREQIIEKIAHKETEIRALEATIEEMRRKSDESEQARLAAEQRNQELAGERGRLSANLGAAKEQARQVRSEKEEMKSSVGSAEIQLEQRLDQLHAVESERDALKTELE